MRIKISQLADSSLLLLCQDLHAAPRAADIQAGRALGGDLQRGSDVGVGAAFSHVIESALQRRRRVLDQPLVADPAKIDFAAPFALEPGCKEVQVPRHDKVDQEIKLPLLRQAQEGLIDIGYWADRILLREVVAKTDAGVQ